MLEELFPAMPTEFGPAMRYVLWRVDYGDPLAAGYSTLNLLEAVAWFLVAAWVVRRRRRSRQAGRGGAWEHAYAALFVLFGLSDVVESQVVPLWLIAAKGLIFAAILAVRWVVVRRYYPGAAM